MDAVQREKNIKHWPRKWKIELIEKMTPIGMIYFTHWPEQEDDRVKRGHDENLDRLKIIEN